MLVETYEQQDEMNDEAGRLAADHESLELIEKLGLTGQMGMTNKETVTRFPYRQMTEHEQHIYGVLCAEKTKIENFSSEIIPLRVLQVAAYAKEAGFFKQLTVWHPKSATIKDPVLVGEREEKSEHGWMNTKLYILARWGKELLPLEELEKMAFKIRLNQRQNKLKSIMAEVTADLSRLNEFTPLSEIFQDPYYQSRS